MEKLSQPSDIISVNIKLYMVGETTYLPWVLISLCLHPSYYPAHSVSYSTLTLTRCWAGSCWCHFYWSFPCRGRTCSCFSCDYCCSCRSWLHACGSLHIVVYECNVLCNSRVDSRERRMSTAITPGNNTNQGVEGC